MPVQQHVLNWLYSILTSEYHDVNRTYNDVAHVLARYPSLTPRTDVHTFPNGSSALLLHLAGTIPVNFRGSTYRFPLSVWVPHAYPREPPLLYVTPTETMMVRPGQHVDPQGQVYHPYLVGWAEFWDKSTLQDFLGVLSDVFAKEPPVVSRQQPRPAQRSDPTQSPPPVPPLPPEMTPRPNTQTPSGPGEPRPPPPPPKPHQEAHSTSSGPTPPQRPSRYESAPPLPSYTQSSRSQPMQSPTQVPPQHHQGHMQGPPHPSSMSPSQPQHPPAMPYGSPPPPPPQMQWQQPGPPQAWGQGQGQGQPGPPPQFQQHPQQQYPQHPQHPQQQQQTQPPQPPPNLLDEPLTLDIPTHTSIAAPPIPPNPEKDALLRQLAQTLYSIRQRSRQQNESSMAGLRAQKTAMMSVIPILHSEMGQLTQLSNVLTSNASILHDALRKADSVIEGSRSHPAPDIDELLVAPTVVSNQLYTLVAEERALGDAIFMLGRAVERGRVSPAVFAKMTRSLAREWYLKKALARKIATGMGMAT